MLVLLKRSAVRRDRDRGADMEASSTFLRLTTARVSAHMVAHKSGCLGGREERGREERDGDRKSVV